jgi:hypothetical protein
MKCTEIEAVFEHKAKIHMFLYDKNRNFVKTGGFGWHFNGVLNVTATNKNEQ